MNNLLKYKNFTAKVEFSADDNLFVGKLIDIDDEVMFEAETVDGLKQSFEEAVDFHIEICKKENKRLKKSYNGNILFRFPSELHAEIAAAAARNGKSINEFGKEVFESVLK